MFGILNSDFRLLFIPAFFEFVCNYETFFNFAESNQQSNIVYIFNVSMLKKLRIIIFSILVVLVNACSEGKLYQNNKEHVKLGQNFAGKFYKEISKKNLIKLPPILVKTSPKQILLHC